MRSISVDALTKLAQKKGVEPIFIIEIDWAGNGHPISYADRTIGSIKGRILEVGEFDNIINIDSSNSQQIAVTLDDTDGTIKAILDTNDVQQRPVSVYQFFDGLDLSDKFLLFQGKLKSPIIWSEGDRTVSVQVEAQLEDNEFGFSAEEGDFDFIPKALIGKPWPVIFGKALDVPALQVKPAVSGTTLAGVGIVSGAAEQKGADLGQSNCGLGQQLGLASIRISLLDIAGVAWRAAKDSKRADEMQAQANDMRAQSSTAVFSYQLQQGCALQQRQNVLDNANDTGLGSNPLPILGLEDFPQNTTIRLNINGGLFTGIARADGFHISSRKHVDNDDKVEGIVGAIASDACNQQPSTGNNNFHESIDMPDGTTVESTGFFVCTDSQNSTQPDQIAQHFWADAGSRVVMDSDEPITYIVSITPGTVLAVKAWKTLDGDKRLINVPPDQYTVRTTNYGPVTAVEVVMNRPLSTLVDQGWSDDVFVTFESTIGPNTVDILEYIIQRWTSLTHDTTTFDAVETKLEQFPMNTAFLERENTIDVIKRIAFAARCAVWIDNGEFKLKYLAEEPDADDTITVSDIANKSVEVALTPTEDIVTKLTIEWRLSWADETPEHTILRHNIAKYGTKADDFDFSLFNQPDVVLHGATFWMIRKANTWKRIRFKTYLTKLNLETFDTVLLDLPAYVASGPIKAMVEKANYNSADNTIDFECLVPVRAGEMTQYPWFWPAAQELEFVGDDAQPTSKQLPIGYTGVIGVAGKSLLFRGQYDNATAYAVNDAVLLNGESYCCIQRTTGNLPNNTVYWKLISLTGTGNVFVGGPNVLYLNGSGGGSNFLKDDLFFPQSIFGTTVFGTVNGSKNPNPNLKLNYQQAPFIPQIAEIKSASGAINIKTQRFYDPDISDRNAIFHFAWDTDKKRFLAGSAFLKETEDGEGGGSSTL